MCRSELPRVFELINLIDNRAVPSVYFQNFERDLRIEKQKREVWLAREAELDKLDEPAWDFLKREARPYLIARDPSRGWEQLISILNQAHAYGYLDSLGCCNLRFVARSAGPTPDLEGELRGERVFCEVKTVNISDEEASARRSGRPRAITDTLAPGFLKKLTSHLETAKKQIETYSHGAGARRIAFLTLNFDDLLGEYKQNYYRQIDDYLGVHPVRGVEVVFYNQRTCFHGLIAMRSATVVNE